MTNRSPRQELDREREFRIIAGRREAIGRYIKIRNIGEENETLHIRSDELIKALMEVPEFKFSATLFETLLMEQIEGKILNRLVTPDAFNALCDYIWKLAVYCTSERLKDERDTARILEDRARRARERRTHK